ncbi:MAG: GNAT family N-acetyltransferase [Dehalococcoidia bacterium]
MNYRDVGFERLSQRIDEIAEKWDTSGAVVILTNDRIVHKKTYGFADREKGIRTSPESTYLISAKSPLLLGLCIMQLIDRRRVSLRETLDRYVPEYRHASKITVRHLLYRSSGIRDYFYSGRMIELSRSKQHQALADEERFRIERYEYESSIAFDDVLAIIGDAPLEFEPGSRTNDWSASNVVFLQEIIERVSGMKLVDYQRRNIFEPLGMTETVPGCDANTVSYGCIKETVLVRLPVVEEMDHAIRTTVDDLVRLIRGIIDRRLLSRRAWKRALVYDREGRAVVAENVNGIACGEGGILGYEFNLYFDQDAGLAYIDMSNEIQRMRNTDGEWYWFRKDMRRAIEEETTYPRFTSLKAYTEQNYWDAMSLAVDESQRSFVLDAKTSLCYTLAKRRVRRPYVLMEGKRAVGLLVLAIDKRRAYYNVDILLVDKKYQRRGFGKIMLRKGLEILKRNGARRIEIGVSRYNVAAQRLYFSMGFERAAVYEQGMALRIDLDNPG